MAGSKQQYNLYWLIAYVVDDKWRFWRFLAVLVVLGGLAAVAGLRVWL